MPVPTNLTPDTAIEITSLPFSSTQQVDDGAGNIYTVWYKFTPSQTMEFGGLFSANGNFTALTQVFSPSDHQMHFGDPTVVDGASSAPFELPFNGGQTYYFKIIGADYFSGDAILTIICLEFTTVFPIPAGSVAKNNDPTPFEFVFPIIFADPTVDDTIIGFVQGPIPQGEHGDVLKTGVSLLSDQSGTATLFDQNYNVVAVISLHTHTEYLGLTSNAGQDRFWVVYNDSTTGNANIISINPDGTTGVARDMGSAINIDAIAVNAAETFLYYRVDSDNHIKRWDLINNVDLGNFIDVGQPNLLTTELLCLVGGDIITGYTVSSTIASARAYNSAGTFVNEFQIPAHTGTTLIRLARGQNDTTTAWIMAGADTSHAVRNIYTEFRISDFTQVQQFANTPYNAGVWADVVGFPPDPADFVRWGLAVSCPFWITRTDYSGPTATLVIGKGSNPLAPGNFTVHGPSGTFVLTNDTYHEIPVAAGTYSITEDIQLAYLTQYYVSNDPVNNDNTAVVVHDNDLIDVVIINLLSTDFGGLYQLTPGLKHDILRKQDASTVNKVINWFWELYTDRDK